MSLDESKIERLKKLLEVANEGISEAKFLKAFESVIKLVLKIEKDLQAKNQRAIETLEDTVEQFKADKSLTLEDIKSQISTKLTKIKEGRDGIDGRDGKNGKDGKSGADGRSGKDGKDVDENKVIREVLNKIKTPSIEEIVDKVPIIGEKVRDSLELLNGDERLDAKAVKGLEEIVKILEEKIRSKSRTGMKRIPIIRRVDLSGLVNGQARRFLLPADTEDVLAIDSSQFPFTLANVDFTLEGNTLVFGSTMPTINSGQTLIVLIRALFYA